MTSNVGADKGGYIAPENCIWIMWLFSFLKIVIEIYAFIKTKSLEELILVFNSSEYSSGTDFSKDSHAPELCLLRNSKDGRMKVFFNP